MLTATTDLVKNIYARITMPTPIVEIGGAESKRQFVHFFDYEVWDRRLKDDVDSWIDITLEVPRSKCQYASTLLCFDTLEHIWELQVAAKNIGTIVKQNGLIVIGVPFCFPHHDGAGDFWRLTPMALEELFRRDFNTLEKGGYGDKISCGQWGESFTSSYFIGTRK